MHCHYDQFVINSVSNHPHGKRIFTSAPMVTCFVRKPSRSHILEKIGILKRGSERCKPDRPLTVTQQLLQRHVTVEFQGSMGKFVQLSTQIRAYRNSRGRREKGVFLCVACTCVYTEILRTLKRSSFKQHRGNTCGCSRNSSLHIAQGCPDSPCWIDLALTCLHSPSVSPGAGATNPNFWAIQRKQTMTGAYLFGTQVTSFVFNIPSVRGGEAESSTYSPSSCRFGSGKGLSSSLSCGFLDVFLFDFTNGSEMGRFGCSSVLVMWS